MKSLTPSPEYTLDLAEIIETKLVLIIFAGTGNRRYKINIFLSSAKLNPLDIIFVLTFIYNWLVEGFVCTSTVACSSKY